jgi:hypothetical protein
MDNGPKRVNAPSTMRMSDTYTGVEYVCSNYHQMPTARLNPRNTQDSVHACEVYNVSSIDALAPHGDQLGQRDSAAVTSTAAWLTNRGRLVISNRQRHLPQPSQQSWRNTLIGSCSGRSCGLKHGVCHGAGTPRLMPAERDECRSGESCDLLYTTHAHTRWQARTHRITA